MMAAQLNGYIYLMKMDNFFKKKLIMILGMKSAIV